jgi:SAM-dependent methyltransferase
MNKKVKIPWHTKDAMQQIYANKLWGGEGTDFFSGEGSHDVRFVEPYLDAVISFLTSFSEPLTVCDLGCGDFNVGKDLVAYSKKYYAIDIVEDLIKRNQMRFKAENLDFLCLDIAQDSLPVADCVLVRQVLQHLSNTEVAQVLDKLVNYKYIILTEHLPKGSFVPNLDIVSGQGIRLKKQSGLDISAPPFSFKFLERKELLSIDYHQKGRIDTVLYQVF